MIKNIIVILFLSLSVVSCGKFEDDTGKRTRITARATGDVIIGAVAPWSKAGSAYLWQGIEFAVEEVNNAGGIFNRKIRIVKKDDEGSVRKGRLIAQSFAEDVNMVAVIGHHNSYISVPASSIYEHAGLLMVTPSSTKPELTKQGFRYVFTTTPNDEATGKNLADFALKQGYKKIIIYYIHNSYGVALANCFEKRIENIRGVEVVDRLSYNASSDKTFQKDLRTWKENYTFDAIFLAGSLPESAMIISQARKMGIKVPIFCGDSVNSPALCELGGKEVEGTVVTTFFNPSDPRPEVRQFNEDFKKKYGVLPEIWAVQGYDTVKLIVSAMQKAGSVVPIKIADALHSTKDWPGISGSFTFNERGEPVDKSIYRLIVRDGKFECLSEQKLGIR